MPASAARSPAARGQAERQKRSKKSGPSRKRGSRPIISRKKMMIMLKMIKMDLNFKRKISYTGITGRRLNPVES
jgi:hypothetical protein